VLRLGGWLSCCKEKFYKEEVEMRGGKEGRALGHILNFTDGLTNEIILIVILSVVLSVSIPCHCKICCFESHCITVRNVIAIYWWNIFVSVFMDELYRQFHSISNYICKNLHIIAQFSFFLFYFDHDSLGIYWWHISKFA
jgi:hypothetical protein